MSNSFYPAASPASGATRAVGTESSLPSGHLPFILSSGLRLSPRGLAHWSWLWLSRVFPEMGATPPRAFCPPV